MSDENVEETQTVDSATTTIIGDAGEQKIK